MRVQTNLYFNGAWEKELDTSLDSSSTLITIFGAFDFELNQEGFGELFEKFPNSIITGCSTAGEIYEDELHDGSLSIAITQFEKSSLRIEYIEVNAVEESITAGADLVKRLMPENLRLLLILAASGIINGSNLVKGFNRVCKGTVPIVGGMAGDAGRFEKTWVLVDNKPMHNYAVVVGFYGEHLNINYSSEGGWNKFGLERVITSCDSTTNTIFTLDHKPALELYKYYMGEHAKALPGSALKFPFLVIDKEDDIKIRAIFGADEETQSVILLDDIEEGDRVVFLKGSSSYIISGAQKAATDLDNHVTTPILNLVVSCMGRRAVLRDRTEDEIEIIKEVLGDNVSQVGFYSYGELSPRDSGKCGMLNQTMTLTLIWES